MSTYQPRSAIGGFSISAAKSETAAPETPESPPSIAPTFVARDDSFRQTCLEYTAALECLPRDVAKRPAIKPPPTRPPLSVDHWHLRGPNGELDAPQIARFGEPLTPAENEAYERACAAYRADLFERVEWLFSQRGFASLVRWKRLTESGDPGAAEAFDNIANLIDDALRLANVENDSTLAPFKIAFPEKNEREAERQRALIALIYDELAKQEAAGRKPSINAACAAVAESDHPALKKSTGKPMSAGGLRQLFYDSDRPKRNSLGERAEPLFRTAFTRNMEVGYRVRRDLVEAARRLALSEL